jgi:hypothetical protein
MSSSGIVSVNDSRSFEYSGSMVLSGMSPVPLFDLRISLYVYLLILVTCTVVNMTSPSAGSPLQYPVREKSITWVHKENWDPGLTGPSTLDSVISFKVVPALKLLAGDSFFSDTAERNWGYTIDNNKRDSFGLLDLAVDSYIHGSETFNYNLYDNGLICCDAVSGFVSSGKSDLGAIFKLSTVNSYNIASFNKSDFAALRNHPTVQNVGTLKLSNVQNLDLNFNLPNGKMAYFIPRLMNVDTSYRVIVSITKSLSKAILMKGLDTSISHFKDTSLPVSSIMDVSLIDEGKDDFNIDPISHREQPVDKYGNTIWQWNVEPLTGGRLLLGVHVSAILTLGRGQIPKDIPVYDQAVEVHASVLYPVKKFSEKYWQYLIATFIIPFFAKPFFERIWGERKGEKEEEEKEAETDGDNAEKE